MNLLNNLGTLESAGLIQVAKVEPDLEYLFSHSLVQDAAYASLLESDRKRLHLAVADAIESLYPERKRELAAMLGYHYKEAGQDQRALTYFLIAGDEALAVYANREAEIQYKRALELSCCSDSEIARLYSGLGEALYRQSQWEEATEAYRNGISIYYSTGDSSSVARLYARIARTEWYAGNRPLGLQICLEGLERVKETPDSLGKAILIHETARAYYFDGQSDKALPLCRQALTMAEQFGDLYAQADTLATLGLLSSLSPAESLEVLQKAVDLAEANGFFQVAMRAHINLGTMTRAWRADNNAALVHYLRSAELGRLRGVASEELIGLTSYVSCLFAPGRITEIEAELPHLEELVRQLSNPASAIGSIDFLKGVLEWYKGNWKTAISAYEKCLAEAREHKNYETMVNMLNELSYAYLEQNRWGERDDLSVVDSLTDEAIRLLQQDQSNELMWVYPQLSELRARQGRVEEAREWLEKCHQLMASRPTPWVKMFTYECEMEIASAQQDWDAALAAVEKLTQLDQNTGFRAHSARNLVVWSDLLIRRGQPADLENAQTMLWRATSEFNEMAIGAYTRIIESRLKMVQAGLHSQALDNVQMTRDLKKARQVQESLLPEMPPDLPGWQVAVILKPARETSGDFYDFISLPDGRLGLVIADVTDKGTSAALYMAMSRSLWRTYALDHPSQPEHTLDLTNQRILTDTHGGLYITLFYGVLNPITGEFNFCSAGHHPAYLLRRDSGTIEELVRTGIPLGVMDQTRWNNEKILINKGDALVLYTDGITDAMNEDDQSFSQDRLKESIKKISGSSALEMRDALLNEVRLWVGNAQQFDDITLLVVVRDL